MDERQFVTPDQIANAKATGWTVRDLNDNPAGLRVRTPTSWVLVDPEGKTIHHGWSEADAWQGLGKFDPPVIPQFLKDTELELRKRFVEYFNHPSHTLITPPSPIILQDANPAIAKIVAERLRQDAKWGEQNHDAGKWSLILTEELGEVAKSQLEGDRANYLAELVQAAAVLVAWIECEIRKES